MFLYSKGTKDLFSVIAEHHWEKLINKGKDKKGNVIYKGYSIIRKVENLTNLTDGSEVFFNDLTSRNYELLKTIIVGRPDKLKKVVDDFESKVANRIYPSLTTVVHGKDVPSDFAKHIKSVFNYDSFIEKKKSWCAYDLCDLITINVCPYCNRNYTFTLKVKDNGLVRPELDHFLPKSKFPYLALSFYNLIPSCHICNSNLKHAHEFDLENYLHPYITSFDEVVRFGIDFIKKSTLSNKDLVKHFGVNFFYGDNTSFEIVLRQKAADNSLFEKAKRNIEVFRIKELYNRHKDLVQDIILSSFIYTEDYIKNLLNDYNGQLFVNREDVLRHITRNYPSPYLMPNRPFSKLTKDIYEEFGITY